MKYFIFNLSDKSREQAASLLRARMWALGRDERHCDALAPGDRVLIHVAEPRREFISRAELATGFCDWTALGAEASLDGPSGGVLYDRPEWYLQLTGIAGAVMTLGALYWWCAAIYRKLRGER